MKAVAFSIFFLLLFSLSGLPADDPAQGHFESGTVLRSRGEFDKAYEEYSRVKLRFPDSPYAPRAQYEMGLCSLYADRITEAMDQFQKVNDWYPASDEAKSAIEMNTILYRIYIVPPSSNTAYAPDPRFSGTVLELDEPTGLSMDSRQNIYLSDKGKKTVTVFDSSGRQSNTISLLSPYAVSIDDQDRAFIANGTNVIAATPKGNDTIFLSTNVVDSGGTAERLEEIRSVAIDETGKLYVISNKVNGILVYGPNSKLLPGYSFSQTLKPFSKVLVNSRNQILALDKDRKQISVYGSDGKFLFTIGPAGKGYTLERVEDFAVDRANHIYLLEKSPHSILVFTPSGNLQKYILSDKKGTLSFDDGKLITVAPSGSIYVLDKDSHRIIKIG